jgi:hypothetical protein
MTEREIEHRIAAIKRALCALGPLRPGSLSRQYNVCGNPTCRCKADPPQRHGPYYQLSYTHRRKSSSQFVREPELAEVEQQLRNYERLRTLVDEWIQLGIERARLRRALHQQQSTAKNHRSQRRSLGNRPRATHK